jgi:hypothetical protein
MSAERWQVSLADSRVGADVLGLPELAERRAAGPRPDQMLRSSDVSLVSRREAR